MDGADAGPPRFVAGSVGPLNVTLSLSPRVDDPAFRTAHVRPGPTRRTPSRSAASATGGVDLLLIETIFDTLNAKAAIAAAARRGARDPALDLGDDRSTGAAAPSRARRSEAFWISIEHADPLIVGVNCSLGADARCGRSSRTLARVAPTYVACHPNAGLPNAFGGYDEQPDDTSRCLGEFARDGLVNIVGGCCGTTPEHIRPIADTRSDGAAPASVSRRGGDGRASAGSSRSCIGPDTGFVMVGERTNITGSARFRRADRGGRLPGRASTSRSSRCAAARTSST